MKDAKKPDWSKDCLDHIIDSPPDMKEMEKYFRTYYVESEEDIFFIKLAEEFINKTDSYDAMVCTGKGKKGHPYPATNQQMIAITKYAIKTKEEILDRASGIPNAKNKLKDAIKLVRR